MVVKNYYNIKQKMDAKISLLDTMQSYQTLHSWKIKLKLFYIDGNRILQYEED
jgi:hypothetical protein